MKRVWHLQRDGAYEVRSKTLAVVECPQCGEEVDLVGETDEWIQTSRRRWEHEGYACATGVHCGLLLVDDPWDGARAFYLDQTRQSSAP